MSLHASRRPFALDPLIAEAKRRARQRRSFAVVGVLAVVGAVVALSLQLPSSGGGSGAGAGAKSPDALTIPTGVNGIAVRVYGRLSVTTKTGFHIHGLPAGAATLSPRAHYVAAGIGTSLVELAPSGRRVWSRSLGEPVPHCSTCNAVAAIAWSPDESRIAYLAWTRTGSWNEVLHVIWRDGTHDTVIDRKARSGLGAPLSWRADSRALAYVGTGARPIIYDLAHNTHRVISRRLARDPSTFYPETHLAFAPHGRELAIGTHDAALLVGSRSRAMVVWRGQTQSVNWVGDRLAVSQRLMPGGYIPGGRYVMQTQLYTVNRSRATPTRSFRLPGPVLAARGRTVALEAGHRVLAGRLGSLHRVLGFTFKPCHGESLALFCEIPISDGDISFG